MIGMQALSHAAARDSAEMYKSRISRFRLSPMPRRLHMSCDPQEIQHSSGFGRSTMINYVLGHLFLLACLETVIIGPNR